MTQLIPLNTQPDENQAVKWQSNDIDFRMVEVAKLLLCFQGWLFTMDTQYLKNIENFFVAGINYKKSDASIRGQFAISNEQYERILEKAADQGLD